MIYKGFKIGKVSRYIFHGFDNTTGYYWNVNFNYQNRLFRTLKEAKDFVNNQLSRA